MKHNYPPSMREIAKFEGGYVNHPRDPGGATNKGIIQRVYNAYRKQKGLNVRSVRSITQQEVDDIYRTRFADVLRFDELPGGVDFSVMDFGVNSGPSRSAKYLQRIVGVRVDGRIGVVTLRATNKADPVMVVRKLNDARLSFVRSLRIWSTFGTGWARRIARVRFLSLQWAARDKNKKVVVQEDIKSLETKSKVNDAASKGTGTGAVVEGGYTFWADYGDLVTWILAIICFLAIAGAIMFYWRGWINGKVAEYMNSMNSRSVRPARKKKA